MKTQNQEPKIVRKPKEKKPVESEVIEKPAGKVAQIEVLIVEILKEAPITKKEMIEKCPSEHNKATWQTRIYRLISKGVISFDKETKMLSIEAKEQKPEKVKAAKVKKSKPKARVEAPCFI